MVILPAKTFKNVLMVFPEDPSQLQQASYVSNEHLNTAPEKHFRTLILGLVPMSYAYFLFIPTCIILYILIGTFCVFAMPALNNEGLSLKDAQSIKRRRILIQVKTPCQVGVDELIKFLSHFVLHHSVLSLGDICCPVTVPSGSW